MAGYCAALDGDPDNDRLQAYDRPDTPHFDEETYLLELRRKDVIGTGGLERVLSDRRGMSGAAKHLG